MVVTFCDVPFRINAATGMTFMTAACGIVVVGYHVTQVKTVA
jgi:hypothetical protein